MIPFSRFAIAVSMLAAFALTASLATATPIAIALTGNTSTDGWTNASLTIGSNSGFPGFPGTGAWPRPIESVVGGDAQLVKIANGTGGGPYPAGGSIYYGGFSGEANTNGGTLAVTDATPVADLANVLFQIEIGEAWTYDFFNHELPTLTYSFESGNATIGATAWKVIEKVENGTVEMPTGPDGAMQDEPIYLNTYLLQWDLSGVTETITGISISFTAVQHAQLYALQLDQSSVYTQHALLAAVPEPATYAAIIGGLALVGVMILRRRKA